MPPLSAVILTHNSAETIEATLAALTWCDEIVVVDSGSVDSTLTVCARFGARILHRPLDGFGAQKRFATEQARNDWVFVVDSDEVVTEALRDEILDLFSGDGPDARGYEMAISLVFLGRLLRFGGEYNKTHLRLFDRRAGAYNLAPVHEQVEVEGRVRRLRGRMLHYSYRDVEHYLQKFNHYTSLAARDLCSRNKQVSAGYIALRMPVSFLRFYVIKGCMLDGYPGFVWALLCALYPTVKFIKLREMLSRRAPTREPTDSAGAKRSSAPAADARAA
jgi:glycosyltransferase involved in cell wall biosynthesis